MPHLRFSCFAAFTFALLLLPSHASAAESTSAKPLAAGFDRSNFDSSIKPGEDFFQYVNGNWVKQNPIPAEYSRWGMFMKLRDDNLIAQRQILEDLDKAIRQARRQCAEASRLLQDRDGRSGARKARRQTTRRLFQTNCRHHRPQTVDHRARPARAQRHRRPVQLRRRPG